VVLIQILLVKKMLLKVIFQIGSLGFSVACKVNVAKGPENYLHLKVLSTTK
jgi:hypothetical protein